MTFREVSLQIFDPYKSIFLESDSNDDAKCVCWLEDGLFFQNTPTVQALSLGPLSVVCTVSNFSNTFESMKLTKLSCSDKVFQFFSAKGHTPES